MLIKNHVRYSGYEAQQMKLHVLGADPSLTSLDGGRVWWDSATKRFRGWDGTAAQTLTNLVEAITGDSAIAVTMTGKSAGLAIPAATGAVRGTMASADKTKLDAATNAATANALVLRDGNGDISVANVNGTLLGTANNALTLGGQSLAQVRDFSLTTGQRGSRAALSDIDTVIQGTRLDQITPPTANVSMNNQRLVSGADPVNPQDFATKFYTDSVASGLDPKASMRLATTTALASCTYSNGTAGVGATLTASTNGVLGVIDSVTPAVNNRILVKNQASQPQNGFYAVTSVGAAGAPWILTRVPDADQAAEVTPGMFTFIEEGTTLNKTGWVLGSTGAITIGTTNLVFTQFSGAGTYLNGSGLSLTGSTFAVLGTANRISVGTAVDIDAAYVGQTSLTTVGTISTGVWQGTTVAVASGGTGGATALAARTNLSATTKKAADIPAGTTYTYNHGLGTLDFIAMVKDTTTGEFIQVDIAPLNGNDTNNIVITFGETVTAGAYRVIVIG